MFQFKSLLFFVLAATSASFSNGQVVLDANVNGSLPVNFGMVLFPDFEALDVFGPLDALNLLSLNNTMNLALIADTMDPVSTKPWTEAANPKGSDFGQSVVPTHTYANPPKDLEVLFVPGGTGTRSPHLNSTIDYIRDTYPSLKYIISVCTGSWLTARAGILDGRNATSNKRAWEGTKTLGNNTNWITHARWVVDGNVWSSSGVSAGIDATLAWIGEVYGNDTANEVSNYMEYTRHVNASDDPFADLYGL